jgi:hypothetical protein
MASMPHIAAISLVRKSRCQGFNPCARGRLASKMRPPQPARAGPEINSRPMQRQHCHSEEVIDRRRICIKVCVDRFLTALRLSFSSLLGIIRKRSLLSLRSSIHFVQNDKVGLSRWDDRSRSGRTICCRRRSALRAVPPAAEARKRAPQAAPDIPYEVNCINIRSKPLFRILRRIPISDCYSRLLRATATMRRETCCATTADGGGPPLRSLRAMAIRGLSISARGSSIRCTATTVRWVSPCAASKHLRGSCRGGRAVGPDFAWKLTITLI